MILKQVIITILTYLVISSYTIADELHLHNGDQITGRVIELSPTYCVFESHYQAILHIKRSDIVYLSVTPSSKHDITPVPLDSLSNLQAKGIEETTNQAKPADNNNTPDVLGEPPEEDLRQIFLRQSTVLVIQMIKQIIRALVILVYLSLYGLA
jgi:hypothetical protein